MLVNDLVVLGNAVPDEISDRRKPICTAGYSPKHGLMRVYPVPPSASMKRWNVVEVQLKKNPQDTRVESWKIVGSKSEWDNLDSKIIHRDKLNRKKQIGLLEELFGKFGADCVQDLNYKRVSLGLIKPKVLGHQFKRRKNRSSTVQTTLLSQDLFLTIRNYEFQPRIQYRCSGCKSKSPHDQQLLEWGIYEWMRKHPDNKEQAWTNMRIDDPAYEKMFLVGNMARHRSSFMIVSVFRHKVGD